MHTYICDFHHGYCHKLTLINYCYVWLAFVPQVCVFYIIFNNYKKENKVNIDFPHNMSCLGIL